MSVSFRRRRFAVALGCCSLAGAAAAQGPATGGVRPEREVLVRAALPMARQALLTLGEFPPFGLGLAGHDEVTELTPLPSADGTRAPDAVTALRARLAEALRIGEVQATALVYEATIAWPTDARADAIAIQLAMRDGYTALIIHPYRFENGDVVLGEPEVIERKPGRRRGRVDPRLRP